MQYFFIRRQAAHGIRVPLGFGNYEKDYWRSLIASAHELSASFAFSSSDFSPQPANRAAVAATVAIARMIVIALLIDFFMVISPFLYLEFKKKRLVN